MSFLGPMQTSSSRVFGAILRQRNIPSSRCLSFSRPVQSGVELKHAVGRSPAHHQGLESEEDAGLLRVNSTGDFYIDLGRKRRATVSSFKGATYLDIREFYDDAEGEEAPGKKGIALTPQQWEVIKNNVDQIDRLMSSKKS